MNTALIIFLTLLLEFVYDPIQKIRNYSIIKSLFTFYNKYAKEFIEENNIIYFLFIFISVVIIIILNSFFESSFHWTIFFIFNLLILLFCLKPNEFNQKIDDFKLTLMNKISIDDSLLKNLTPNLKIKKNDKYFNTLILENFFFNSSRNIFSVLFWFLLLGPAGAIGYRFLDYLAFTDEMRIDQKSRKEILKLLGFFEYIPIRLTCIAFAVVGNFQYSINSWKNFISLSNMYESNINLINSIGMASLEFNKDSVEDNFIEKITDVQTLISRSLLAWLSIITLLILGGFFN